MASALRTASWVLLVIVGGLTVLGSMASCAVALRGVRDPIVSSITIDDLSAGRPEIAKALRARRLTAAAYAAAFGVMVIVVAAVPYRRGEVWAWWAILAGALAVSLPILARVPFIETRTGAGTGLLTLVVVLVALLL